MVDGVVGSVGGQKLKNQMTIMYKHAKILLTTPHIPGNLHGPQTSLKSPLLESMVLPERLPGVGFSMAPVQRHQRRRAEDTKYVA